ncbi:ABC transporter ATP-binding protein [Agarilytica rhodophyticola]|uniref:ABC transporter ATP-binding protein n=1 Tax=Agarilytica rhodophyticola TaxID=1737490 RepID=UPI000B348ADB|nr:ABC transporter ATP-binding protein [Agarilytica rhodophyticola]
MSQLQSTRIDLSNISHWFSTNNTKVQLFDNLSLSVIQGQSYAITGPSGSGKSTLLMLMAGLEQASHGHSQYIKNNQISTFQELREDIGFIFQQFHLLPELSAIHNVALPLKLRGYKGAETKAEGWLRRVGLGERLSHKPQQLSGGEQQRVAIARALIFDPKFIFADEPTGNLDAKSADDIADILLSCCQEKGAGLILVTHSNTLAARAQHQFYLKNGRCDHTIQEPLGVCAC